MGQHPLTKAQVLAAVDRMDPTTRALLKRIVYSDSPTKKREALHLVEIFHYMTVDEGRSS